MRPDALEFLGHQDTQKRSVNVAAIQFVRKSVYTLVRRMQAVVSTIGGY